MAGTDVLMQHNPPREWAPGIWTLGGQGNTLVVSLGDSLLMVDAGPGKEVTARMIAELRALSPLPVSHIVYSHGHVGYNNGVQDWLDDAARRGHPPPQLVAHQRVPVRYRRYRETAGLQSYSNTRQFRSPYPADPPAHWYRMPTVTYETRLLIQGEGAPGAARHVVLLHAPSETDDATALWVPDCRLLYGSCAMIKSLPNAGTPYRIHRHPRRWLRTLESFLLLDPAILVPEFGRPLTDAGDIHEAIATPIAGLRWLIDEVTRRMNRGEGEAQIVHEIRPPPEIFEHRFMKQGYGCIDYLVRDIWRGENGWWDRNVTTLHPARRADAANARYRALPDPARVLAHAQALAAQGHWQRALHVVDLLALADDTLPLVAGARALKAELLERRATQMTSAVSRQVMLSSAEELRGEPIGAIDIRRGDQPFNWT